MFPLFLVAYWLHGSEGDTLLDGVRGRAVALSLLRPDGGATRWQSLKARSGVPGAGSLAGASRFSRRCGLVSSFQMALLFPLRLRQHPFGGLDLNPWFL